MDDRENGLVLWSGGRISTAVILDTLQKKNEVYGLPLQLTNESLPYDLSTSIGLKFPGTFHKIPTQSVVGAYQTFAQVIGFTSYEELADDFPHVTPQYMNYIHTVAAMLAVGIAHAKVHSCHTLATGYCYSRSVHTIADEINLHMIQLARTQFVELVHPFGRSGPDTANILLSRFSVDALRFVDRKISAPQVEFPDSHSLEVELKHYITQTLERTFSDVVDNHIKALRMSQ